MEQYLVHHGILGMHWGVRRYQNPDGTLTDAGKKRYSDVEKSNLSQKIDTSNAKYLLKTKSKMYKRYAEDESRSSEKLRKKSEKYAEGTEKNIELLNKSNEKLEKAKKFDELSKIGYEKLKDIESGKLKAGKDFIVQKDFNINLTKIPAWNEILKDYKNPNINSLNVMNPYFGTVDYTLIENRR